MFIFLSDNSTINTDNIAGTSLNNHGNLIVHFIHPMGGDRDIVLVSDDDVNALLLGLKQANRGKDEWENEWEMDY